MLSYYFFQEDGMNNNENIGKKFCKMRENCGYSQSQIASYLGVDQSYISKCEKNERQFSADKLQKAADLFACSTEYFLHENATHEPLPTALRADCITEKDFEAIAAINKIVSNLCFMENMKKRN